MGMDKFAEVSAKTKENLMEIFKEFYMEIYHKNKKKFMEKKNKNMKTNDCGAFLRVIKKPRKPILKPPFPRQQLPEIWRPFRTSS